MASSARILGPAQAGAELGVSAKALRLYERHGLLQPDRSRTGWRTYDRTAMERAAEIVALRGLGLSLVQVARVLDGDPNDLDAGLALHESRLHRTVQQVVASLDRLRSLRADLAHKRHLTAVDLTVALAQDTPLELGFALPWPWDGEWFALRGLPRLAFITGPLGSGKTRLARALAGSLPDAAFVGLDRLTDPARTRRLADDPLLAHRVEQRLAWLVEDGAARSDALAALVVALESATADVLVVDMVEDGLDGPTQTAVMAHLRLRGSSKRAIVLMTRSTSILDPDALYPEDAIIMCPANHSPPFRVVPYRGGHGFEALATCVAAPDVRARTAGIVAPSERQPSGSP